ncbi:pancreatic lipase-related protein 2 isoform X2 [Xenopus laevis]|uniref:Triacylglycerol lipase n=1 Tax=Xenopus laevis TaxID=8355 RepID=A0A8J1LB45_XENLA|nr:pancreatic lipase-related protein 2 isoform X2 [Xenopus laevis]
MFYVLGLISFLVPFVQALKEICYEGTGCFENSFPWAGTEARPERSLSWAPEQVNTRFLLFTKDNPDHFQEINSSTIFQSHFQTTRKTRFVIHGYTDSGDKGWVPDMCKDELGYSPSLVHIIGHSLGAHAAGEAGKQMPSIGRITGLDPAQPYFQNNPTDLRLDPTDARLVDVIHTDTAPFDSSLGLGINQLVGHLDFFPNGGIQMPGCKHKENYNSEIDKVLQEVSRGNWTLNISEEYNKLVCNHLRSYKYYMESIITPDGFIGFPASSYLSFSSGDGFPCPADGCPLMGHYADSFSGATEISRVFYLNTGDSLPFARWRYQVTVHISAPVSVLGLVRLSLLGINGKTKMHQIFSGWIQPKQTVTAFIDVETKVGRLKSVDFIWSSRNVKNYKHPLEVKSVTVEYGRDGTRYYFCGIRTAGPRTRHIIPLCNRTAGPKDP